jgi:hypothetical protein
MRCLTRANRRRALHPVVDFPRACRTGRSQRAGSGRAFVRFDGVQGASCCGPVVRHSGRCRIGGPRARLRCSSRPWRKPGRFARQRAIELRPDWAKSGDCSGGTCAAASAAATAPRSVRMIILHGLLVGGCAGLEQRAAEHVAVLDRRVCPCPPGQRESLRAGGGRGPSRDQSGDRSGLDRVGGGRGFPGYPDRGPRAVERDAQSASAVTRSTAARSSAACRVAGSSRTPWPSSATRAR